MSVLSSETSPQLEHWQARLNSSCLPAFARSIREIAHVASANDSSAADLSEAVSHDVAVTTRLLQIANSSLFNVQGGTIDTVSSAVVLVGFNAVRDLAVTISLIDEMLKGKRQDRVARMMAHAIHSAVHAKGFAASIEGVNAEEVFVATLLKEVGHMAFWSQAEDEADAVQATAGAGKLDEDAQREVLGFALHELSAVLADSWNLGELAKRSHQHSRADDQDVACVRLSHDLARCLEQYGLEHPHTEAVLAQIESVTTIPVKDLRELAEGNLEAARALISGFGIKEEAATLVAEAVPKTTVDETRAGEPQVSPPQVHTEAHHSGRMEGVVERQLDYLDRIALALEQGLGRDEIMQVVIEGAHVTLDAAGCYFLLATPDREHLVAKYSYGWGEVIGQRLAVTDSRLFAQCLAERKVQQQGVPDALPWHRSGTGLASGIFIGGKSVGVLYGELDREVTEAEVASFRQFSQQVALVLAQAA